MPTIKPKYSTKHDVENRYCSGCMMTTRHSVKDSTYTCLRCGSIKHPTTRKENFERTLINILGLNEAKDAPETPKPEGTERTSAEGAHRPDKGVKFIEMPYDDQFKTKADYDKLSP